MSDFTFDNDPQTRYERIEETGFADMEDLDHFLATHRERRWCSACERHSLHRDHLEALGYSPAALICLGCLARTKWWEKDSD